ncbi:molecular chaperone HtpG [Gordonia humi]|uniref:Chaperone protein HtpG n=1 Tax=Gordonia humi TaxID=686429 RepID=A0A840EU14_9ACTN|nr:molecular chaperone HtpG [Gordonia humi]
MTSQVHEFQAEARQLLDLMVHSIYSNKDSFLRELISNASDALDKLRLEGLRDKDLDADISDLHIRLIPDAEARTLTIVDNGIGMTREEVVDLIGTVAKSGTAELRRKLAEADNASSEELIGQFGVGFYSTFMVADEVTLVTRKAGETVGTRWASTGDGTYTIDDAADAPQGTAITLALSPVDTDNAVNDYTDRFVLRGLVKKYSDFIAWPIRMLGETPAPVEPAEGEDAVEPAEPVDETLNSQKALWSKNKSEVTDEEYADFYRHVSHAWDEPLETISLHAEGTFEYQSLLFIPTQAPFDLFMRERSGGIHLYVKRVFIMDDADIMPEYLRWVQGVVDAADLSLNVSREILQEDRQIRAIRRRLTKKVISTVQEIADKRPDDYATFWENFGRVFKEGLVNDSDNAQAILKASVFASTRSETEPTRLADYVTRMADGQDVIYYMTGESRTQLEASPHLEAFAAKGIEVLLLSDPVDEVWVTAVPEFDGKKFVSVAKGVVDLDGDDADTADEAQNEEFSPLMDWLGETLADDVSSVRLTSRLTDSAACLVGDEFSMTPQLEKLYRASGQPVPHSKRILELNPDHALVTSLRAKFDETEDHSALADAASLVYASAVLAEGGELANPAAVAKLIAAQLTESLS